MFNIRGGDILFNPVCISYAIITGTSAHFLVDSRKLTPEVSSYFKDIDVNIVEYDAVESFIGTLLLATIPSDISSSSSSSDGSALPVQCILADPMTLNWRLYNAFGDRVRSFASPITLMKSIKNNAEIEGIKQAHIRDGVALTAFLHWLRDVVQKGSEIITEYDVGHKVAEFRAKMPGFVGPSFG